MRYEKNRTIFRVNTLSDDAIPAGVLLFCAEETTQNLFQSTLRSKASHKIFQEEFTSDSRRRFWSSATFVVVFNDMASNRPTRFLQHQSGSSSMIHFNCSGKDSTQKPSQRCSTASCPMPHSLSVILCYGTSASLITRLPP